VKSKNSDINTRIGSFIKISSEIGEITFNGTCDATVKEVESLSRKMNQLMDHKKYYLINNLKHDLGSFPPEVWHFLGTNKEHNNAILGSVVITNSPGYKMQINFFFTKFKPKYPYSVVNSKEEANRWIDKLMKR